MPSWYPEDNDVRPSDNEARALRKWNSELYNTYGNVGTVPFPEGTQPLPSDNAERSYQKINAILAVV